MKKRGIVLLVLVLSLFFVSAVSFNFNSPSSETEQDSASINLNFFNVTGLLDFVFKWGSTNYSVYDEDLILMMDFNNDSDLGENDSVVKDLSRYGHDGEVLGGATHSSSGKYNGAYSFSEGEGINISAHEDFNVDEFTISMWVKPDKTRTVLDLDSRDLHTCYIDGSRDAWCFGDAGTGKLGDGTTVDKLLPVKVLGNHKFREIAVSEDASCGILTNDSVVCWGEGGTGELGNGEIADSSVPVFVDTTLNFTSLTSANHIMCGYLENGSAVCWGYGSSGQFGDGVSSNRLTPTFIAPGWNFTQYTFGEVHTCGILYNGTVYCWGNNHEGERGDNSTLDTAVNVPVPVYGDNLTFKWIDAGEDQNCGILTNGSLMCWGENSEYQLGVEGIDRSLIPIFANTTLSNFERVYLSKHVGFGFLENGSVVAWGFSITVLSYGDETYEFSTIPKIINWDFDYDLETLTNPVWNSEHYCFINDGLPYCWGAGPSGEIGLGFSSERISFPYKFVTETGLEEDYDKFYFAGNFYCFEKNDKFYCAGSNYVGQLGVGEKIGIISEPSEVYYDKSFKEIYFTANSVCGLLQNGSAMCWGKNNYGQIGDNSTENKLIPTPVYGNYNFSNLFDAVGPIICGLLQNDSVLCWGDNNYGQLGDNTTENRYIPVSIYGNYNFSEIFLGYYHTCGLLQNGSAMCWGRNNVGQLGDNTIIEKHVPVFIFSNYTFKSLSGGGFHTCGLLQNGSAMCWGNNNFGQLGREDVSLSSIPLFVSGNYEFSKIFLGLGHSCGLTENNKIICWGRNDNGQLGRGNFEHNSTLMEPLGNMNFDELFVKQNNVCGIIKNSQEIYCWGAIKYFNMGKEIVIPSTPISIYTEDLLSKEEMSFKIGLTYGGNLRAIYALRYFDYELNNDWNNIVLNIGDTVKLFVNGELVNSHHDVIIPKNLDDLEIGKKSNAQIDDLMMWNRSLTDDEIEFVYKSNLEKLNETSWSFTSSFSDLVERTYRYGVYVQDSFGWIRKLRNLRVDFPDAVSSSGGGLSVTYDLGKLKKGVRGYYPKNYRINFDGNFIKVKNISEDKVELNVSNEIVEIDFNESVKVDSDSDGFYDLEVSLGGMNSVYADLSIKSIYEEVPAVSEGVLVEGELGEEVKRVGFFRRLWDWIVGLFR